MLRSLTELHIHQLRNISSARLALHPQHNLFYGANGSGKTSLLESIYLLSTGYSFRTRETTPLISHGSPTLTIFSRTIADETISIQKSVIGSTQVKLNRQPCYNSSDLARFLPCQVFYQDIFQVIDAGPAVRRSLLDWGLFHVEPTYHSIWKDYRLVVKQRNALLRQKAPRINFIPWDRQLVDLANTLDTMRMTYFSQWSLLFQEFLAQLADISCDINYYKGWDKKMSGKDLSTTLEEHFIMDTQRQYTHAGAHQADILFDLSSKKAKQILSRGQQKIILIALKLAQASLVPIDCLYLFDDIAAELDSHHMTRLLACLATVKGQQFYTAIDGANLNVFHQLMDSKSHLIKDGVFASI